MCMALDVDVFMDVDVVCMNPDVVIGLNYL